MKDVIKTIKYIWEITDHLTTICQKSIPCLCLEDPGWGWSRGMQILHGKIKFVYRQGDRGLCLS